MSFGMGLPSTLWSFPRKREGLYSKWVGGESFSFTKAFAGCRIMESPRRGAGIPRWWIVADQVATTEVEKRAAEQKPVYGIVEIMKILPHRYPFLLVDRIIELEPEKRVVGLKNVTINEQYFQGHFPGAPVMPGVLIIEAMAQVAGVMIYRDLPDRDSKLIYFTGIENAKFRRPVVPGDQLRIEMELLSRRPSGNFGKMIGRATVEGKLAAEATVVFAVSERPGS